VIYTYTLDELSEMTVIAEQRMKAHAEHRSSRPLSPDYEVVGLLGELTFEKWSGYPMDRSLRIGGDNNIDFTLDDGRTVDSKAAQKANNLLLEVGKESKCADILVLAGVNLSERWVNLIGWASKSEIVSAPRGTFGHPILNHYIPAIRLNTLPEEFKKGYKI
jgi:hypothetical protein